MKTYSKSEITGKLSKLMHKCGVLQRKRNRLDRVKAAFKDFRAGRITKTELRSRVPRSWVEYA